MSIILFCIGALFIMLNGRNDGALVCMSGTQRRNHYMLLSIFTLAIAVPLLPFLGFYNVAESLETLMGTGETNELAMAVVLSAVLIIVAVSAQIGIPTSITLALIGALVGSNLAYSQQVDVPLLTRTLILGLSAPFVAAGLAAIATRFAASKPKKTSARKWIAAQRSISSTGLAVAYAANDGQKTLFGLSLMINLRVQEIAHSPVWLLVATSLFMAGTVAGLRKSGRFLRHGVTAIDPIILYISEASTTIAVLAGSFFGTPLSLTQSLTGALFGAGTARSIRSVKWQGIRRIIISWVWTLPSAAGLSFLVLRTLITIGIN